MASSSAVLLTWEEGLIPVICARAEVLGTSWNSAYHSNHEEGQSEMCTEVSRVQSSLEFEKERLHK